MASHSFSFSSKASNLKSLHVIQDCKAVIQLQRYVWSSIYCCNNWQFINLEIKIMRDLETPINPDEEIVCEYLWLFCADFSAYSGIWGYSQMCAQLIKCGPVMQGEFRVGGFVHVCLTDNFMQSEYLPICSTSLLKVWKWTAVFISSKPDSYLDYHWVSYHVGLNSATKHHRQKQDTAVDGL